MALPLSKQMKWTLTRLYWLCQTLGWGGLVTLETINYYLFMQLRGQELLVVFLVFLANAVTGIIVSHGIHLFLKKIKIFERNYKTILLSGLLTAIIIAMALGIINITHSYLFRNGAQYSLLEGVAFGLAAVVNYFKYSFSWALAYFMTGFLSLTSRARVEQVRAESLARQVELELLKSQINPHFLFNALNSIKALCLIDPQKAREAIVLLSELLRFSLNYEKQQLISLQQEIYEIDKYLALEKIRFGDRLHYNLPVLTGENHIQVPPAAILTLVENAIKHGIARVPAGGEIRISVQELREQGIITIISPGQYNPGDRVGIGLQNTIRRLAALNGPGATVRIYNLNPEQVATEVVLPRPVERIILNRPAVALTRND